MDGAAKATAKMQQMLAALRPAQSNSCGVAEMLNIFVHEWADDACIKQPPLSSEQQSLRKQFMRNNATGGAMKLFKGASAEERECIRPLINMLMTDSGRAELVNTYGIHDPAPDVTDASVDDQSTLAPHTAVTCDHVFTSRHNITLAKLAHADSIHLNGACGTITGYDEDTERYIIALAGGARVLARRGNIVLCKATACEAVAQLQTMVAHGDITTLHAVYGEHTTTSLVQILLSIPNRKWTVADDLWLISEWHEQRDALMGDDLGAGVVALEHRIGEEGQRTRRVRGEVGGGGAAQEVGHVV